MLCLNVGSERKGEKRRPNTFVSSKSNWRSNPTRAESSIGLDKSEIIREEFKPFVLRVKILRDTGATQSLL